MQFKPGDVIMFKSGGPKMVVKGPCDNRVECVLDAPGADIGKYLYFLPDLLTLVTSGMAKEFTAGDVVTLKSGGRSMVALRKDGNAYQCAWMCPIDHGIRYIWFPEICLIAA